MSTAPNSQGPSDESVALAAAATLSGGLPVSTTPDDTLTLASLPIGARLILRCRKDWRGATVMAATPEAVTLSVYAPSGRTYRVRRPPETILSFDGTLPLLGEGSWRAGFARYDTRW